MPPHAPEDPAPDASESPGTRHPRATEEVKAGRPPSGAADRAAAELELVRDDSARLQRELATLRQDAAALHASEERYRQLFARAGEAILILRVDGTILEANAAAAKMHGYSIAELEGMSHTDLDAPDMAFGIADALRRASRGEWIEAEAVHVRKDGTRFPIEFS